MAQKDKGYLHFRASRDLIARIDEIKGPTGNRSEVIRALLYQALGDSVTRTAAVQAVYDYTGVQRKVFRELAAEMNERLPEIVDRVIADAEAAE